MTTIPPKAPVSASSAPASAAASPVTSGGWPSSPIVRSPATWPKAASAPPGSNGGDGLGGGLYSGVLVGTSSTLTITDSAVTHNLARGGRSGTGANGGNGLGGGLFNDTGSTLTITDAQVTHNFARGGFGGLGQGVGGGVYSLGVFVPNGAVIKKNHASTTGNDDIFPT